MRITNSMKMQLETSSNLYGVTTNPFSTQLTCGGSSGGEGARVALKGKQTGSNLNIRFLIHFIGFNLRHRNRYMRQNQMPSCEQRPIWFQTNMPAFTQQWLDRSKSFMQLG